MPIDDENTNDRTKEICFDTMYDRDKTWPEESLKRLEEKTKKVIS